MMIWRLQASVAAVQIAHQRRRVPHSQPEACNAIFCLPAGDMDRAPLDTDASA